MSNITLYSEEKLINNTNFVNSFLDQMIEQYCEKRYEPGVAIASFSVPSIREVILDYYPTYYFKAPGLLASNISTDVMIVYEPHLHDTLQQALEHKFSRLFIQANSTVNLLRLMPKNISGKYTSNNPYAAPPIFPLFDNSGMLIDFFKKSSTYTFKFQDLEPFLLRPKVAMFATQPQPVLLYKPDVSYAMNLQAHNKSLNEKLINDLCFFDISFASKEGFNQELAFTIHNTNSLTLSDFFTPDFCIKMHKMASEIMKVLTAKVNVLSNELLEKQRAKERRDAERKAKHEEESRKRQSEFDALQNTRFNIYGKLSDAIREETAPAPKVVNPITPEMVNAHREKIHEDNLKQSSTYTNQQTIAIIVMLVALFIVGMLFLSQFTSPG